MLEAGSPKERLLLYSRQEINRALTTAFLFPKQEKSSRGDKRPVSDPSPFVGPSSTLEAVGPASLRTSLPDVVIISHLFSLPGHYTWEPGPMLLTTD
jgi:hypothetical protein